MSEETVNYPPLYVTGDPSRIVPTKLYRNFTISQLQSTAVREFDDAMNENY